MSGVVWTYDNVSYTLTEAQADEVEAYSKGEEDDSAFNKWFLGYAKTNSIKSKTHGRAQWWSRVPDSKDDISRLVSVKQSAHTLMKVVDPTIKIQEITFDDDKSAYSIPSEPARKADSLHAALDDSAGFTIHSAFKQRFSGFKPSDYSFTRNVLESEGSGKHHILDSLVTMRSNYQGLQENPGFSDYIDSAAEYVYNGYTLPAEWPSETVNEQIAALIAPSMYGSRVGDSKSRSYSDKIEQASSIIRNVVKNRDAVKTTYLQAIEDIYKLLDADDKGDKDKRPLPVPMSITGDGNFKTQVSDVDADEIDDRVEMDQETLERFGDVKFTEGLSRKTLIKIRPIRIDGKSALNIKTMGGSIVKADAHLRLKKTLDKKTEHFQKSGDLDEDELYRLFHRDDRVFMNVEEEQEESASIHFLVDVSGSMSADIHDGMGYETRVMVAAKLAWLFAHSMNKRPHVKSHVWAHTGDTIPNYSAGRSTAHNGPIIFDIWQSGEDLKRLDITVQLPMSQNYDGYAIEYVGNVLHKEDALKKYLIVLSDGQPSAGGYGGHRAMTHVRNVTDALSKKDIYVVQIAIGSDMRAQAVMFKHFVPYKNVDQMIREFAKILDRVR